MSIQTQEHQNVKATIQPFRVDVRLHDLLKKPHTIRPSVPHPAAGASEKLPEPVFPRASGASYSG